MKQTGGKQVPETLEGIAKFSLAYFQVVLKIWGIFAIDS